MQWTSYYTTTAGLHDRPPPPDRMGAPDEVQYK
jgi:hypothetical protein